MFSEGHTICRLLSYVLLFIFAAVDLGISSAFIAKTESTGHFYYRAAVVLLVASICTLLFTMIYFLVQRRVKSGPFILSIIGELTCLVILSGLFLGGISAIQDRFINNTSHCAKNLIFCAEINLLIGGHRQNVRVQRGFASNQNINRGSDVWGSKWDHNHENATAFNSGSVDESGVNNGSVGQHSGITKEGHETQPTSSTTTERV